MRINRSEVEVLVVREQQELRELLHSEVVSVVAVAVVGVMISVDVEEQQLGLARELESERGAPLRVLHREQQLGCRCRERLGLQALDLLMPIFVFRILTE